jgi:fermentation-respiration switch protein FrsA (DUF1100 family)
LEGVPLAPETGSASRPPPRWWKRILRTLGLAGLLVIILGTVLILIFENSLIYFPTKGGVGPSPGQEVWLTCSDGVKIHGWYVAHPDARVTLLFLHGNAGNLEDRRDMLVRLRELPANVLLVDYRGYGRSEGKPDEPGLYRDARAAYDWLLTKAPPGRIVVLGKSLGAGPACELASTVPCGGLIVQSAFTRAPDMASRVLPLFFWARWIMSSKYDNLAKVASIRCPKLFIHSRSDEIIPFVMAERLFAAAADPKEHEWYDGGAGHNDLWIVHARDYFPRLARFLGGIAP